MVKNLCVNLLPKYPSENFVMVILDSLSALSCETLIDIPDQVNLLLTYLEDPRRKVRCQVLLSLKSLAEKGPHLWSKVAMNNLLKTAMNCTDIGNEQTLILRVVLTLTNSPVTCHSLLDDDNSLITKLCSSCLVLEHHSAASLAMEILTSLVFYCHTENQIPSPAFMCLIDLHLESLLFSSWASEKHLKEFASYLKCGIKLSENNHEFGENFVELIGSILLEESSYSPKHTVFVAETLGALCAQFSVKQLDEELKGNAFLNPIHVLMERILKKTEFLSNADKSTGNVKTIEILSAVIFQALLGYDIPLQIFRIFEKVLKKMNCWSQYRIARSASRFGHHFMAAFIYRNLSTSVSIDKLHFFLTSLFQIGQAECVLVNGFPFEDILENYSLLDENTENNKLPLVERLDTAISLYWKALATLKASSSPTQPMTFQSEFVRLRGQFLEALFNVVITKNTQTITPPPAIAQTLAQNSRDHLQKYGHVTNQLRKSVKTFKVCEDLYSKLYKSSFNADPGTLEYLDISKFMCSLLGHSLEMICFASPSDMPNRGSERNSPETKFLLNSLKRVENELNKLPQEPANKKSITNLHTDILLNQIELITKTPACIPRFFFQVLQNTSIKLSVLPTPRPGEPVSVSPNTNLVVKVEGVIQHYGPNPSLFRSIESVQLNLVSQLLSNKPNEIKQHDTIMTQMVKPHHDFLSGSFLLPLNNIQIGMGPTVSGGQWQVTVEACVIDQNGCLWNTTGPKITLQVRVPDDPSNKNSVTGAGVRKF